MPTLRTRRLVPPSESQRVQTPVEGRACESAPSISIRVLLISVFCSICLGCTTHSAPTGPMQSDVLAPAGFTPIASRVPQEKWKRVFFRITRDIRLLPKLHPHIHDLKITLLRDDTERTLLFMARARLTGNADENFWKTQTRRLYEPELSPDFVQIRHYANRSLTESEAYLQQDRAAKTVIAVSDDRRGNVHIVGGSRLIGGAEPFVLDQIIRSMTNVLNR